MNLTFVPNALEKISPTWVMSDITYPDGIITRTEDDYLRRIGSTFKGISFLGPGYPAWFEYSKDNLGAKLGDTMELQRYIDANKIQLLPFSDLRGFDTTGMNCAVYITEAQNLDIEMMRLALQRIGEDSICIIDGDYDAQVDLDIYSGDNNGMRRLSQVFRGQDFYGEVKLQKIYRSRIAALAQEM